MTNSARTTSPSFLPSGKTALFLFFLALGFSLLLGPLDEKGWRHDPLGRIPPGREPTIEAWLNVLKSQNLAYENAQIEREQIIISSDKLPCAITLQRPGAAPQAARTPSFAVKGAPRDASTGQHELCADAANQVAAALKEHDTGYFYHQAAGERIPTRQDADRMGPDPYFLLRIMLETLSWLAALLFLWTLLASLRRTILRREQADGWIFGATSLAIMLRIGIPPAGPVHANEHGVLELLSYTPAAFVPGHSLPIGLYGFGGDALFRVLATISGLAGTELLIFAAILLGLCTPIIGVSLRAMGCTEFAVRLGMLSYACSPFLIRAAPTESPLMMAALLAASGYLLIYHATNLRKVSLPWLLLGVAMITLSVQIHLVTICWLLPLIAVPLAVRKEHRRATAAATIVALIACAPHVIYIVRTFLIEGTRAINPVIRFAEQIGEPAITLFNPGIIPFAWLPLGLWALLRLGTPLRPMCWLTLAPLLLLSVSVSQNFSDVLRYQAPIAFFFLMLSTYAVDELRHRAETLAERGAYQWALVTSIIITGLFTAPLSWTREPESELTRAFERAAADGLLSEGIIVPVPSSDATQNRPVALPAWGLPAEVPRDNPNATVVLLGTRCVQKPSEEPGDYPPLDPGCARAMHPIPQPVRLAEKSPSEFAGLQVWFMVPRPEAPPTGIYRAKPKE